MIARNTVIDHYKTKKVNENIEDIWDLSGQDDLEKDVDTKIKLEKIEKYIGTLKSEQRDILIMRLWQGMSYKEIAEIYDCPVGTVLARVHRALKTLRKAMETSNGYER